MDDRTRNMWQAIDEALPDLRALTAEMRTRGQAFTADRVMKIANSLASARKAPDEDELRCGTCGRRRADHIAVLTCDGTRQPGHLFTAPSSLRSGRNRDETWPEGTGPFGF